MASALEAPTTQNRNQDVESQKDGGLLRELNWKGAFWVAAGVPPLVLFSLGGVAGIAGKASWLVWILSSLMGFSQSFTYAEMAGMFPNKSGGASVYGAMAWIRYSKFIAPLSVWLNWLAWSPVLALSCSLAAGYILRVLKYVWADVHSWQAIVPIPGLNFFLDFNLTFVIGAVLMLGIFAIQHRGISFTKNLQKCMAILVLAPLLLAGLMPMLLGHIQGDNLTPVVPPVASGSVADGSWTEAGSWTLILGALYIAAWTTYAFETSVCYTSELTNPRDTVKAITSSGILCCMFFWIIPFSFQAVLGPEGVLAPDVADGSGIPEALSSMIYNHTIIKVIFTILMLPGLFLAVMTAMAGSSRTLYQGSVDGWLPKYLAAVNEHGAPVGAMLTDLALNLFLLALASDPEGFNLVMACSNVFYITFNFLNLNAGWIHRIDSPNIERPWKAPTALIYFNTFLAFVNALFLGAGSKAWGYPNALWIGFVVASLIFPVFAFRHYFQDGGRFPENASIDLGVEKKAGILPYLTLLAGLAIVLVANFSLKLPQ